MLYFEHYETKSTFNSVQLSALLKQKKLHKHKKSKEASVNNKMLITQLYLIKLQKKCPIFKSFKLQNILFTLLFYRFFI